MKTILALIVVAFATGAVLAQTPQASQPSPPALKSEEVSWQPIYPAFVMGNLFPQTSVGSFPVGGVPHPRPLPGNRLSYRGDSTGALSAGLQYGDDAVWWLASVRITNESPNNIKFIRMAFVFTDPISGGEVLRIDRRSRKRLKPGESYVYLKTVKSSREVRGANGTQLKLEITEVLYGDGTVWRLSDVTGKTE
ncbi:MAG TPA: hypothetical protein VFX97_10580 [Pyrinomonadaceae bacterium]|nr:hypothetical protein [Pyrinomonadaceae bacterium]